MKFVIALLALACIAEAQLAGGWSSQNAVTDNVMSIARWATNSLAGYSGVEGTSYTMMSVRNVQTQVVSGINYRFTLDVLMGTADNKYYTCQVTVYDQPWTNTRRFVEAPKCGANPQYPSF